MATVIHETKTRNALGAINAIGPDIIYRDLLLSKSQRGEEKANEKANPFDPIFFHNQVFKLKKAKYGDSFMDYKLSGL
jgi:hypothetical protein